MSQAANEGCGLLSVCRLDCWKGLLMIHPYKICSVGIPLQRARSLPLFDRMAVGATKQSEEKTFMSVPPHLNGGLATNTQYACCSSSRRVEPPLTYVVLRIKYFSPCTTSHPAPHEQPALSPALRIWSGWLPNQRGNLQTQKNYCASNLFMHYLLLAIPDVSHPHQNTDPHLV